MASILGVPWDEHIPASQTPAPRFAFVRHPLDRPVSLWEFSRVGADPAPLTVAALDQLFTQWGWLARPQVHWIDAPMDFIGRFERLHEDWSRVSAHPLPHFHKTDRRDWPSYFDDETRAFAENHYRDDFTAFGY